MGIRCELLTTAGESHSGFSSRLGGGGPTILKDPSREYWVQHMYLLYSDYGRYFGTESGTGQYSVLPPHLLPLM